MPLLWRGGLSSCLTSLRDQILTEHSAVGMARGTISSLRMQGSDVSWIRQINTVWSFIESPPSSSVCYKYLFSIQAAAAQFRQSIVYEYALRRRCFFFLWIFIVWLSTCVMHFWSGNNKLISLDFHLNVSLCGRIRDSSVYFIRSVHFVDLPQRSFTQYLFQRGVDSTPGGCS